ncbi:hypothetical protein V6N13_068284 [Hibiscus sabdariffa]|uniref:BZIP domain-containing protein n=1 Tax=Hibiscus sabdariffa TaxID=183260 RepID=A0ABR2QM76_9ROSI
MASSSDSANIDEKKRKRMLSNHVATRRYMEMENANKVLRAQAMELSERLGSLNSMLLGGYAVSDEHETVALAAPLLEC